VQGELELNLRITEGSNIESINLDDNESIQGPLVSNNGGEECFVQVRMAVIGRRVRCCCIMGTKYWKFLR